MKTHGQLTLIISLMFIAAVFPASADTLWTLNDVTFNDGGAAVGSFIINTSGVITSWDITTTAGLTPPTAPAGQTGIFTESQFGNMNVPPFVSAGTASYAPATGVNGDISATMIFSVGPEAPAPTTFFLLADIPAMPQSSPGSVIMVLVPSCTTANLTDPGCGGHADDTPAGVSNEVQVDPTTETGLIRLEDPGSLIGTFIAPGAPIPTVPEPSSLLLLSFGLAGLVACGRKYARPI